MRDGGEGGPYIERQGLRQGDLIDWEYLLTEKKKFGEFSCQGGAMMVRSCATPVAARCQLPLRREYEQA